jgi:methylenetetrahydrofolate dehydrogenase (NADP+)/methenyltetrahydrofolate cyclohydrolase
VSGILVQLPLPKQIDPQKVIERIAPLKDVDGFHPYNIGRLALRQPLLRSCTPYGIMQLLEAYDINPKGMNATIIGVSNIVGRPLALELILAGATITSCNSKTKNISLHIKNADIVISATGQRGIFNELDIPDNAVVIDVGMHRINNKLCGDLESSNLAGRVKYLTPVPGGVGPMTISALLQNTYQAALMQKNKI